MLANIPASELEELSMKRIILLSFVSIMLSACNDSQDTATPAAPEVLQQQANVDAEKSEASIEELKAQLDQLTANKQCSSDTVCRVLPVGKRACGGPSGFVIFSTEHSNTDTVQDLTSRITTLEQAINFNSNAMSICEHLSQPTVQCVANACTATDGQNPAF